MKEVSFVQGDKREKGISSQESPMGKDRKTCYNPEYPDKSWEPGIQRGPKDGMGEQRPKGEGKGFVSYARELGLSPADWGKFSKSFKRRSTVRRECLESSVWLLSRKQIRRRQGWWSGSPSRSDQERMMAKLEL